MPEAAMTDKQAWFIESLLEERELEACNVDDAIRRAWTSAHDGIIETHAHAITQAEERATQPPTWATLDVETASLVIEGLKRLPRRERAPRPAPAM